MPQNWNWNPNQSMWNKLERAYVPEPQLYADTPLGPMNSMVMTPKTIEAFKRLYSKNLTEFLMKSPGSVENNGAYALAFAKTRYPNSYNRIRKIVAEDMPSYIGAGFDGLLKTMHLNSKYFGLDAIDDINSLIHELTHASQQARKTNIPLAKKLDKLYETEVKLRNNPTTSQVDLDKIRSKIEKNPLEFKAKTSGNRGAGYWEEFMNKYGGW